MKESTAEVVARLTNGEIIPLTLIEWESVSDSFELVVEEDTRCAGMITVFHLRDGFAVMEEPGPDQRVLRGFRDEESARRFASERMKAYERMWDGCGCRIDYYG